MKRLLERSGTEARAILIGVCIAGAGAGCTPSSEVQAGAPVLTALSIVEATGARTDVTADTGDCAGGSAEGGACDPAMDAVCRLATSATTTTFCHCDANDPADPTQGGHWTCRYLPLSVVIATFDRLLDTAPLDPGGASGVAGVATLSSDPAPPDSSVMISALADYDSTGTSTGLVFTALLGIHGPRLNLSGQPAVPAGATVTFALDGTKVRAKDGHTPFTALGALLLDGRISYTTQAPPPPDGGPPDPAAPVPADNSAVTIAFDNTVDPATVVDHIHVTFQSTSAPFTDFTFDTIGAPIITLTPNSAWPAGATLAVTVDATARDVVGDVIGGTGATETFTTEAM
jgi:hypothetical protein